jgi:hypothetical protein
MFNKPLPDALISFKGKGVALRNNNGEMVLVRSVGQAISQKKSGKKTLT